MGNWLTVSSSTLGCLPVVGVGIRYWCGLSVPRTGGGHGGNEGLENEMARAFKSIQLANAAWTMEKSIGQAKLNPSAYHCVRDAYLCFPRPEVAVNIFAGTPHIPKKSKRFGEDIKSHRFLSPVSSLNTMHEAGSGYCAW